MRWRAWGVTDVGRRRDKNEDALLVAPALGAYAVADGMGGHAAGEVASGLAIEALREALETNGSPEPEDEGVVLRRLESAVHEANRRIWESIERHEDRRGMGTTLVAMLVLGSRAVLAHVGDSRAYVLRSGGLARLTSDHSWVAEQVKLGLLSDDDARRHPMRNIVTRALGSRPDIAMDTAVLGFREGDVVLLCSDGLNSMLTDAEIAEILGTPGAGPEAICRRLVAEANARGGDDNITVVVLLAEERPEDASS